MTEQVEYTCLKCQTKFKIEYKSWNPSMDCIKKGCGGTARYTSLVEAPPVGGTTKFYKDVTALVVDKKTGEPFWLDKKGKRIRYGDSQVRYDLQRDPRGWRATGRKVRSTDQYGRKQ